MNEIIVKYDPPEEIDPHNVIYWEEESKELMQRKVNGETDAGTSLQKARNFLENNCIELRETHWICKPIKNYNKTTHRIIQTESGLECSCQGCQTKIKHGEYPFCCHILAVKQFIFMERYNNEKMPTL